RDDVAFGAGRRLVGGGGGGFAAGPDAGTERRFGLRHAEVSHGRFRDRLKVGAEAGVGDLFLEFSGLAFKLAGASFEDLFLEVLFRLSRLRFQECAEPFAESKIGEEKEADEVERGEDNGGADGAEMAEEVSVHHQADPAAGAGRIEVGGDPVEKSGVGGVGPGASGSGLGFGPQSLEGNVVCVQIEEANAAEHQDQSPDPAAMEVSHELEQIAEAETEEQDRQKISASAESKEGRVAEPGADRPDQVESGGVGVGGIGLDIIFMIGKG